MSGEEKGPHWAAPPAPLPPPLLPRTRRTAAHDTHTLRDEPGTGNGSISCPPGQPTSQKASHLGLWIPFKGNGDEGRGSKALPRDPPSSSHPVPGPSPEDEGSPTWGFSRKVQVVPDVRQTSNMGVGSSWPSVRQTSSGPPESGPQFMGWYSEHRLGPSSRNTPPASNMSPGAPRATAMMPRTSGDKASAGGVPTPRSIDQLR